jgi:hypothetical protein
LYVQLYVVRIIKDGSVDKEDRQTSAKNNCPAFSRPHKSHRTAAKRTVFENYVSGSLENLRKKKSQMNSRESGRRGQPHPEVAKEELAKF